MHIGITADSKQSSVGPAQSFQVPQTKPPVHPLQMLAIILLENEHFDTPNFFVEEKDTNK